MIKPLAEFRLIYGVVVVCLVFSIYAAYQANHRAYQDCKKIETLKAFNYQNALRSHKALPLTRYYINNPEELRGALNNISQQIQNYAPQKCTIGILP